MHSISMIEVKNNGKKKSLLTIDEDFILALESHESLFASWGHGETLNYPYINPSSDF